VCIQKPTFRLQFAPCQRGRPRFPALVLTVRRLVVDRLVGHALDVVGGVLLDKHGYEAVVDQVAHRVEPLLAHKVPQLVVVVEEFVVFGALVESQAQREGAGGAVALAHLEFGWN